MNLYKCIVFNYQVLKLMMHFNKRQENNEQVPRLLCSVCTVVGGLAIIVKNFNFFFFYKNARAFVSMM